MTDEVSPEELIERLRASGTRQATRDGGVYMSICDSAADLISRLLKERDEARTLAERLKLEAQGHAGEAKTANSTIYEIYQVLSGATGEKGNWNGAQPARDFFARLQSSQALLGECESLATYTRGHLIFDPESGEAIDVLAGPNDIGARIGTFLAKLKERSK